MQHKKSARVFTSVVSCVPLIFTASFFVTSALATSRFNEEAVVEIAKNDTVDIGQEFFRSLSKAAALQSDKSQEADKITLQDIHNINDMDIFGSELMTKSELAKFRMDLKKIKTQGQLDQYLAAHRTRMNERSEKRGVVLE